jgi:predicted aldo/keto reductase-like oxidoreductase
MEACLLAASQLDWIDGIMMTYNYRNMHTPNMKAAIDACTKAGIGLTAMKTMASSSWFSFGKENHLGNQLAERFTQKGFTEEQAKLKAVWTNPQIASICSQMPNYAILKANVAAAVDRTELAGEDLEFLETYAKQTSSQYCAGCANICEAAVDGAAPIGDIMRYHMYSRSYGQADWARQHFQKLPRSTRRRLASIDFSAAQARCPNRMPIAQLMREALEDYA